MIIRLIEKSVVAYHLKKENIKPFNNRKYNIPDFYQFMNIFKNIFKELFY